MANWILTAVATLVFTGFLSVHAAQVQEPIAGFGLVCKTKEALLELYAVANKEGKEATEKHFEETQQCMTGTFLMARNRISLGIVKLNGNVLDIEEVLIWGWKDELGNTHYEKPVIWFATFKNGKESI